MSEIDIDILQPQDFAEDQFYLDSATNKMRLVAGSGGSSAPLTQMTSFIAGGVISGDKAVMFDETGKVVMADPTQLTYVYAGIAINAGNPGDTIYTTKTGMFSASFWTWQFGLPIFVAPGGNLTQVPPQTGYSHVIGRAVMATAIYLVEEDIINTGQ